MTTPTRDELIRLREDEGMTREQIADHYEVSLTTVRRWIKELKIPRPSKQARNQTTKLYKRFGELVADPDDGITIMERAEQILGTRLTYSRNRGRMLDGRPVHTRKVVEAAGLTFKDEM